MSAVALSESHSSGLEGVELKAVSSLSEISKIDPEDNDVEREASSQSQDTRTVTVDEADGVNLTPEALGPLLSNNQYTIRKMAAQGLMDVALMMANISQLRTLVTAGHELEYHDVLIAMVICSLVAQVIFAIIIFIVWMRETEDNYREEFLATIRQVAASKTPESEPAKQAVKLDRAKQEEKFRRHQFTNRLNYCTIVLVFLITVTNMFITGFGIKLELPTSSNTEPSIVNNYAFNSSIKGG